MVVRPVSGSGTVAVKRVDLEMFFDRRSDLMTLDDTRQPRKR
jgi:hypothetical protein